MESPAAATAVASTAATHLRGSPGIPSDSSFFIRKKTGGTSSCSSRSSVSSLSTSGGIGTGDWEDKENRGPTASSSAGPSASRAERPTVTFDPNPIILSRHDGSPMKTNAISKGGLKLSGDKPSALSNKGAAKSNDPTAILKGSTTGSSGPPASALRKESEAEEGDKEAAVKPDEPEDGYIKDLYDQITELCSAKPDKIENPQEDEAEDPSSVPVVWISRWVDYSDKYGLGYQLSDDSIGVLFNDCTKLLLLADGVTIHYIERNGQEHYHKLSDYPVALKKKMCLLCYFRNYMKDHLLKTAASMAREKDEVSRMPTLMHFFRTKSAIVLHLTNGTFQINFFEDHTKIILCPLMSAVTYIDQKGSFRTFKMKLLQKYGCSNCLADRIRYAKTMIQRTILTKSGYSKTSSGSSKASVALYKQAE